MNESTTPEVERCLEGFERRRLWSRSVDKRLMRDGRRSARRADSSRFVKDTTSIRSSETETHSVDSSKEDVDFEEGTQSQVPVVHSLETEISTEISERNPSELFRQLVREPDVADLSESDDDGCGCEKTDVSVVRVESSSTGWRRDRVSMKSKTRRGFAKDAYGFQLLHPSPPLLRTDLTSHCCPSR